MRAVALFRRRRSAPGLPSSVPGFWSWWSGVSSSAADSADRGDEDGVQRAVAHQLRTVDPGLQAALLPGRRSRHALALTAGGRADLRTLAERVRRAGPGDDAVWEYHSATPPRPEQFDQTLEVHGQRVDLAATAVEARVDDQRCRLDVGVFNPSFARLPEEDRERLAVTTLTWALGEDDVERWIGEVVPLEHRPLDSVPAAMLAAVTSELGRRWTDHWSLLEGTHGRLRLVAAIRSPLHRVDHLLFDEHLTVRLPYDDLTLDGLPGPRSSGDLLAFEEALVSTVGHRAVLVAHETSAGERVLHLYDDSTASVEADVRVMLPGYLGPVGMLECDLDPAWRGVEHLRL